MQLMHINIKTLLFCLITKVHHKRPDQQRHKEYIGVKFLVCVSLQFLNDEKEGKIKNISKDRDMESKALFLMPKM